MHSRIRTLLLATTAAAWLGALTASASARNLSTSNQGIRVQFRSIEFISIVTIRCEITLEGSFHTRTIAKVLESLIGNVTRARVKHPCTNGESFIYNGTETLEGTTVGNSLPWHLRYAGFTGTLPNIQRFRIALSDTRFLITALGVKCISTASPARGLSFGTATRQAGGEMDRLVASGTIRWDPSSNAFCGAEGTFGSTPEDGLITLLTTTARITITLI